MRIYKSMDSQKKRRRDTFFTFDLHLLRITSIIIIIPLVNCFSFSFFFSIGHSLNACCVGFSNACKHFIGCSIRLRFSGQAILCRKFTFSSDDLCSHEPTKIRNDYNLHGQVIVHSFMNSLLYSFLHFALFWIVKFYKLWNFIFCFKIIFRPFHC